MKISFYQRGQTVQARISDGKESYRISTGIKIQRHHKFKGEFKGKTAEVAQLNAELGRCRIRLTELYLEHKDFRKVRDLFDERPVEVPEESCLLNDLLRLYVKKMGTGEIKNMSKVNYKQSTIQIYRYTANTLNEFSHFYKPIDIRDFHIDPTWDSARKKEVAQAYALYWKKYEDYLIDRQLGVKSRADMMNITGVMTNYWANEMFFSLPKIPRLSSHEKAIIVMPSDFVKRFLNDEDKLYNTLTPELQFLWEVSATILITTLRIGDALSLNEHNFAFKKDGAFMRKKNEKTGVYSEMPIPQKIANIYRENLARYGRVYRLEPKKDLVYDNIRTLFKMYEDMHELISVAHYDIRGNEYVVTKPLWEWMHPHLLRKTAITNMIYNKVPERFIKFASGHSLHSPAFERYVGHVEKYYRSEINDYYGKIFQ